MIDLKKLNLKLDDSRGGVNSLGIKLDIDDGIDLDQSIAWLNNLDPKSKNAKLINNILTRQSNPSMQMTNMNDNKLYLNDNNNYLHYISTKETNNQRIKLMK